MSLHVPIYLTPLVRVTYLTVQAKRHLGSFKVRLFIIIKDTMLTTGPDPSHPCEAQRKKIAE